ncbi:MAG: hypothetical protein RL367_996 [Pseudomonadota bacterium]
MGFARRARYHSPGPGSAIGKRARRLSRRKQQFRVNRKPAMIAEKRFTNVKELTEIRDFRSMPPLITSRNNSPTLAIPSQLGPSKLAAPLPADTRFRCLSLWSVMTLALITSCRRVLACPGESRGHGARLSTGDHQEKKPRPVSSAGRRFSLISSCSTPHHRVSGCNRAQHRRQLLRLRIHRLMPGINRDQLVTLQPCGETVLPVRRQALVAFADNIG